MKVNVREIEGTWSDGYVLDKHTVSSTHIGHDEYGHDRWHTVRTEVGEALYQLKYQKDRSKVAALAKAIVDHGIASRRRITAVVPMPASSERPHQPVMELATAVAGLLDVPLLDILRKAPTPQLKNMRTHEEKAAALEGAIAVAAADAGPHHVLLVDDLYNTGATMNAASAALVAQPEIRDVSVVALTWS